MIKPFFSKGFGRLIGFCYGTLHPLRQAQDAASIRFALRMRSSITGIWLQSVIAGYLILFLSGCAETVPGQAPVTGQELALGILGVSVFSGVLIYSAFKAFVELNISYTESDRAEYKSRAFGFFIGLLLTALIIAADTEQSPFSTSRALAFFPWYIFSCLGVLLGFTLALASGILAHFRSGSGGGVMVLVLSFIGSSGLYLTLFAGEARAGVFALFVSILIGVFAFRMMFPTGLGRSTQEEARQ